MNKFPPKVLKPKPNEESCQRQENEDLLLAGVEWDRGWSEQI